MTSCSSDFISPDAQIRGAGGQYRSTGPVYRNTLTATPYTVGDLIICLDRPGRAAIDRVESVEPFGGLTLEAFTVIPNAMELGENGFANNNKTIAEQGLPTPDPVILDKPCADVQPASPNADTRRAPGSPSGTKGPQSYALILQYSKTTGETAGNRGITIHYTSGRNEYSVSLAWEILLCAPDDTETRDCQED